MATNKLYERGINLQLNVGAAANSGDPVVVGQIPGVCATATDSNNNASVDLEGVYNLSVHGLNGSGNTAVAIGDALYYTGSDTPPITKKTSGVLYGYALGTVSSGATSTIPVLLARA